MNNKMKKIFKIAFLGVIVCISFSCQKSNSTFQELKHINNSKPVKIGSAKILYREIYPTYFDNIFEIKLNGKIKDINKLLNLLDSITAENKARIIKREIGKYNKQLNYNFTYSEIYDSLHLVAIKELFKNWKPDLVEKDNLNIKDKSKCKIHFNFIINAYE
jgi:hypothetical protein